MIVLAFDTATPATVVGLSLGSGEPLEARDDPAAGERPGHASRLLPLAAELLARAGIGWSEVERFAVGVGPGTFTGLRVGLATAHGLACARGVPLVGVCSLRALALGAGQEQPVLAAIDARRGEIFLSGYRAGVLVLPPSPVPPSALAELLAGAAARPSASAPPPGAWLAVGDGAVRYRAELAAAGATVPAEDSPLHRIRARALCELAVSASPDRAPVLPAYLRSPDAQPAAAAPTAPAPSAAAPSAASTPSSAVAPAPAARGRAAVPAADGAAR